LSREAFARQGKITRQNDQTQMHDNSTPHRERIPIPQATTMRAQSR
jgi:hypothetical protein